MYVEKVAGQSSENAMRSPTSLDGQLKTHRTLPPSQFVMREVEQYPVLYEHKHLFNWKEMLCEVLQKHYHTVPVYQTVKIGEAFHCSLFIDSDQLARNHYESVAPRIVLAEQAAAKMAVEYLHLKVKLNSTNMLNEILHSEEFEVTFTKRGPDHLPDFSCMIKARDKAWFGYGHSKTSARHDASCRALADLLVEDVTFTPHSGFVDLVTLKTLFNGTPEENRRALRGFTNILGASGVIVLTQGFFGTAVAIRSGCLALLLVLYKLAQQRSVETPIPHLQQPEPRTLTVPWYSILRSYFRIQDRAEEMVSRWTKICENPTATKLDPETKLLIIEVKTIIEMVYDLYHGNKIRAVMAGSTFAISRVESILSMLKLARFDNLVTTLPKSASVPVTVNGYTLNVSHDDFRRIVQAYERRENIAVTAIQMETQNYDWILPAITSAFAHFKVLGMSSKDIADANKTFTFINFTQRSATTFLEFAQKLVSFGCRTIYAFDPFDEDYKKYVWRITQFIFAWDNKLILYRDEDLCKKEVIKEVFTWNDECNYIKWAPLYATIPPFLERRFTATCTPFSKVFKRCEDMKIASQMRKTPICILMLGPPGVGKSASVLFLMKYIQWLLTKDLPDGPIQWSPEMSYTYNPLDDFWERYFGQRFFVMDDVWGVESSEEGIRDSKTVIGAVNTAKMPLNMASLDNKGMVDFVSEFIFITSNIADDGWQFLNKGALGVRSVDSIGRRMHLVLHRADKIEHDAVNNIFTVQQSIQAPGLAGNKYNLPQIGRLIHDLKKYMDAKESTFDYSPERLAGIDGFTDHIDLTQFVEPIALQPVVDPQMFKQLRNEKPEVSNEAIMAEMLRIKAYEWAQSTQAQLIIGAAIIAVSCLTASYLGHYFSVQNPPLFDHDLVIEPESKKYQRKVNRGYARTTQMTTLDRQIEVHSGVLSTDDDSFTKSLKTLSRGVQFFSGAAFKSDGSILHGSTCHGFHLGNGVFAVPAHFVLCFERDEVVMFRTIVNGAVKQFKRPKTYGFKGDDIVIFRTGINMGSPKPLKEFFTSNKNVLELPQGSLLYILNKNKEDEFSYRVANKASDFDYLQYESEEVTMSLIKPITYWTKTTKGESGSLIVTPGPQGTPIIVGMHVGGSTARGLDTGLALRLSSDYFDTLLAAMDTGIELQAGPIDPFPLEYKTVVSSRDALYAPSYSRIEKSDLYGIFFREHGEKPKYFPARLGCYERDGKWINTAHEGLKKLHQEPTPETPIPEHTMDWLFSQYPKQQSTRILTIDEAMNGVPGRYPSIDLSTSAGYKLCKETTKGKSLFIYRDETTGRICMTSDFEQILLVALQSLKEGRQIEVIWGDCTKDELRDPGKLPRIFTTCPLVYLIIMRMYFGDFIMFAQEDPVYRPSAVGINPHSWDWTFLREDFKPYSGSTIAGDFSNFDGKLPRFVGKFLLRFINEWYDDGPENARVRELLFEHIYNATRINGDKIYQVVDGNPSGNPFTSLYNSFCNIIMIYVILTEDFKMYVKDWKVKVYGDDNIIGTKQKGLRCSHLAPYFKKRFDMTYTHWSKEEVDRDDVFETTDTQEGIRFLGRAFVSEQNVIRAPLTRAVLEESLYWFRGGDATMALLATIQNFILEAHHFGPGQYMADLFLVLNAVKHRRPDLAPAVENMVKKSPYHDLWRMKYEENSLTEEEWSSVSKVQPRLDCDLFAFETQCDCTPSKARPKKTPTIFSLPATPWSYETFQPIHSQYPINGDDYVIAARANAGGGVKVPVTAQDVARFRALSSINQFPFYPWKHSRTVLPNNTDQLMDDYLAQDPGDESLADHLAERETASNFETQSNVIDFTGFNPHYCVRTTQNAEEFLTLFHQPVPFRVPNNWDFDGEEWMWPIQGSWAFQNQLQGSFTTQSADLLSTFGSHFSDRNPECNVPYRIPNDRMTQFRQDEANRRRQQQASEQWRVRQVTNELHRVNREKLKAQKESKAAWRFFDKTIANIFVAGSIVAALSSIHDVFPITWMGQKAMCEAQNTFLTEYCDPITQKCKPPVENWRFEYQPSWCPKLDVWEEYLHNQRQEAMDIYRSFMVHSAPLPTASNEEAVRDINAPGITMNQELGGNQDVAPTTANNVNSESFLEAQKAFNYETFTLDKVLSREYPIATYDWLQSQAMNTIIAEIDFPQALFVQPFIAAKIEDFSRFKSDYRLTVRLVTNKFLYGKLLVSWVPRKSQIPTWSASYKLNYQNLTSLPHILISASAGEATTFDVPFVSTNRMLNLQTYANDEMGTFVISVLNPLTDANGLATSKCQVAVFAQFINPELAIPFSATNGELTKEEVQKHFETQSKHIAAAASHVKTKVREEAKKKAESGTISSTLDSLSDVAGGLSMLPTPAAPFAALFSGGAKAVSTGLKMFGLDKPTTVSHNMNQHNPFFNWNYGQGVDTAPKISTNPESCITSQPVVGAITADEMDLKYITMTPVMTGVAILNPTSTAVTLCNFTPVDKCYCDIVANWFSYWSATVKVKLYITASTFHSVRLALYFNSSASATSWPDCYHRVVDVQGDTEIELSFPWASELFMQRTGNVPQMFLQCSVIGWSQPDPAVTTNIYCNIYKAFDSDAQFSGLLATQFRLQSADLTPDELLEHFEVQANPRADFAKSFEPIHPSATLYTHDKIVTPEQVTSLRDIIHRTVPYFEDLTTPAQSIPYTYDVTGLTDGANKYLFHLEAFGQMFLWWRGAIRVVKLLPTNTRRSLIVWDPVSSQWLAGSTVSSFINPKIEIEVPYYYQTAMRSTRIPDGGIKQTFGVPVGTTSYTGPFNLRGGGDDFSFVFLAMPDVTLPGYVHIDSTKFSEQGLRFWTANTTASN